MRYRNDIESRFTARHRACIDFSGDVKDKVILDIGCWIGWYEKFIVEKGCKLIIGIDVDYDDLQKAKGRLRFTQCDFVAASALRLPFRAATFDLVSMFDVLEHVSRGMEFEVLSEANKVLKKRGTLLLSVPNNNLIVKFLDPAYFLIDHRHYSPNEIETLIKKAGFSVHKLSRGGGIVEALSMILLYIFKYAFNMEIPLKALFEWLRDKEYRGRGFATLFAKAVKIEP